MTSTSAAASPSQPGPPVESIIHRLLAAGYDFVPAQRMHAELGQAGSLDDWQEFSDSWNRLALDEHMADHGRYRRRRHAVFAAQPGSLRRAPHQAHFQALQYNALNGGIERWFEPMEARAAESRSLGTILDYCHGLFSRLAGHPQAWHVEVHQFRIEAMAGQAGLPTPEGMHRDGVDYVLVLLVRRCNIDSGTTLIGSDAAGFSSSFTLVEPFDAALVDDHRVFHGVTPVQAIDPSQPAYRDVLVVTFRRR